MKMCDCEATRFEFNLNSHIRFKPTEFGKIVYKAYWMPYSKSGEASELKVDNEGWSEMQLWDFICVFGQSFTCGMNCPVETTVVLINNTEEQLKALKGSQ